MFEAEVNNVVGTSDQLPQDIRAKFREFANGMLKRTVLPWGEHCTECVWPSCYETCGLYTRRLGGGCRLFLEGMVRVPIVNGPSPYVLKIGFKPWAKLWTVGNIRLYSAKEAYYLERLNMVLGATVRSLPFLRAKAIQKLAYWRRIMAEKGASQPADADRPDYFVMEIYNPNDIEVDLTLTIRPREGMQCTPYQKRTKHSKGFSRTIVQIEEICKAIALDKPFEVELAPNDHENTHLYFGMLDFVKEQRAARGLLDGALSTQKDDGICKCIIWDLDNTVWDGVLVEDGPEGIKLRKSVVTVIKETDRRGILHSIASKNNKEDVMKVLQNFGIAGYFLYPQVNWEPKSQSIAKIAQLLNIGIDSLMFVDDQEFERTEVTTNFPEVMALDAKFVNTIPQLRMCDVPITEESKTRRLMYREQEQREIVLKSYEGDYLRFLKECEIRLILSPLDEANIDRVFELTQRTNQMNFSGNRYPRSEIERMVTAADLKSYVIKCEDRFGSYGIVGFAVVDVREPRLLDLMFSCRVQGKKVEHAFLAHLLKEHMVPERHSFHANYRRTPKNENAGQVFDELRFREESEKDGITCLVFDPWQDLPCYDIIEVAS